MRSLLAYSNDTPIEERVTLRIRADNSGDLYVPTAWYAPDGRQVSTYYWKVTAINAISALDKLKTLFQLRPDGVVEISWLFIIHILHIIHHPFLKHQRIPPQELLEYPKAFYKDHLD